MQEISIVRRNESLDMQYSNIEERRDAIRTLILAQEMGGPKDAGNFGLVCSA